MSAPAPAHLPARTAAALQRMVRGTLAASVTAFLLAGLPYGLIRYIGWPLPHHLPSLAQLRTDLTSPILGDQVYLDALAIVIWLLWLLITVSFALETVALARGVEVPALPGLRPTQALAVVLLTAIGITALAARTAAPAHAATTAAPVPARPPAAATASLRPAADQGIHSATATDTATAHAPGPSLAHPAESEHTVAAGDNLFDIARADYGNGNDWPVLYARNAGLAQTDGRTLTNPDMIQPGWIMRITDPSAQPATSPANDAAPTPSTATPSPNHAAGPRGADSGVPAHGAQTARRATGSGGPGRHGADSAPTPRHTSPPAPARDRLATARPASRDWIELAEGGALAAGVLAALGLASRRARRLRRWYGSCYWPSPGQRPTEPPTVPVPLRPAQRRTIPGDQDDQSELDPFGAPAAPDTSHVENHISAAPAAFERKAHQHPPVRTQDMAAAAADLDGEQGPARIAVASADGRILTLQDLEPALALTGPGALSAARAAAAAVLSATWRQHDGARLLICRQDAALLLECAEADLPTRLSALPDLELAAHSADALTQLEQEITYRTSLLEQGAVTALEEVPEYDEDYFPPVVLLAVTRPEHTARIDATIQAATGLRTHAILLGEHPGTTTWHVEADGRIAGPGAPAGARMFHLSAQGLSATLALLQDATGDALREQGPLPAPDPRGELAAPETDTNTAPGVAVAAKPQTNTESSADRDTAAHNIATAPQPVAASTAESGEHAEREQPAERRAVGPGDAGNGPLLLAACASPDRIAQITEQHATRPVRIKVLGIRAITTPTGTIDARLRADAWRAAMKLAIAGRRGQHLDDFATLWPDHEDQLLRKTVKNAIYDLRKTLKQRCQDPANHPGRYIAQANHRYTLNEQTVSVDLAAFTALRTLAAHSHDLGERTAAASAALALYDGDLLTGQDEEWTIAPRTKARRDALATATLLAQLADQAGEPETALNWWERALQIDDNEEVYRQIITLQLRLGHRADALSTRDLLITRLDADDLAPAPATMDVLARLHNRRPTPGDTRTTHQRAA
jgi:DNA-binding SARP family transcriptional activator